MPREPSTPSRLKRSHAQLAQKTFFTEGVDLSTSSTEVDLEHDSPDLASYFDAFGVDPSDRIKMCRAYASYLSSQEKVSKKRRAVARAIE